MEDLVECSKSSECQKNDPEHAILIDRLYEELMEFSEKRTKTGDKIATCTWTVVTRAIMAAARMNFDPEEEEALVTEAAQRVVKKLGGEDVAAAELEVRQIPMLYSKLKPVFGMIEESHVSVDDPGQKSNDSAVAEIVPIADQSSSSGPKSVEISDDVPTNTKVHGTGGGGSLVPNDLQKLLQINEFPNVPEINDFIASVDHAMKNLTSDGEGKPKSCDKTGNSSEGNSWWFRFFARLSSVIATGLSWIAKVLVMRYPALASILNKIATVLSVPGVVEPMVESSSIPWEGILVTAAVLTVVIVTMVLL